ncbi:EamA family transporter [Nocardioides silvaticus]|uniref:EamA family transporter n=1 Tax=Nocardioides silvaticus TaxID=2201891 RepID=A0A316TB85_9ACTN|nr:EamA family transporter [Nocardioides silvaticus]PWN01623.1 EamA family transporter [Nocardioides silvaticus]
MTITAPAAPPTSASSGGQGRAGLTAVTALTPVVWGTTYLVTTELLPSGHPAFAAAMRAVPAGLLALLIARQLPHGVWWWRSLVIGTLNIGIFFPLLFVSAERLPGGVAATFGAVQPLVVAGLAIVLLHERPSVWRFGWGVAGLAGVALVVLGPDAGLDAVGVAAGVAGAVSMALGVTLAKRWGRPAEVSAVGFAGWQLTAGGVVLVPLSVVEGPPAHVDGGGVAGYLWLGIVGGLVAYTLWFRGIGRLPVTSVAMLGLLSPIVAAALGALVLGETFAPLQVAGFSLALVAILGSQLPEPRSAGSPITPLPSSRPIEGAAS